MPRKPPRPCSRPGCTAFAVRYGRCEAHQPVGWEPDRKRGNRHQRGYGAQWERRRKAALRRDSYLCQPCLRAGVLTPTNEVDHIIPKAHGGTDADSNLQAICCDCHSQKTAREGRGGSNPWP